MKKGLWIAGCILFGVLLNIILVDVFADELNTQDNTSVAQTSSSMSNVQVNNSALAESSYGGGVRCSETTMGVSVLRSFDGTYIPSLSISAPLFASKCKSAAAVQIQTATWRLMDAKHAQSKKDELHEKTLEIKDLQILEQRANLANLCAMLPDYVKTNNGKLCGHLGLVHSSH